MKKQILTLIIGILIGAIITTGVFLIFKGNGKGTSSRGERPSMDGSIQRGEKQFSKPSEKSKQNTIENTTENTSNVEE